MKVQVTIAAIECKPIPIARVDREKFVPSLSNVNRIEHFTLPAGFLLAFVIL